MQNNRKANEVGWRPLLARTCSKCGMFLAGENFRAFSKGRKNGSVICRRNVCKSCENNSKKKPLEKKKFNPSFIIGDRPLVAKTCLKCGLFLPAEWFSRNPNKNRGKKYWDSSCRLCKTKGTSKRYRDGYRYENREGKDPNRSKKRLNELTLMHAEHNGDPWTQDEESFLKEDDGLSVFEKAISLGRTYNATLHRMSFIGSPGSLIRFRLSDNIDDAWVIRFKETQNA